MLEASTLNLSYDVYYLYDSLRGPQCAMLRGFFWVSGINTLCSGP